MRWSAFLGRSKLAPRSIAVAFAALFPIMAAPAATEPRHVIRNLVLDVLLNGRETGMLGDFTDDGEALFASPHELRQLGFHTIPDDSKSQDALIRLDSLVGVSFRVDERTQSIQFTASDAALDPARVDATPAGEAGSLRIVSGMGVVANYDLGLTRTSGRTIGDSLLDLRAFAPWGVLDSSAIATSGGGGTGGLVRLDTTFDYADSDGLTRYRAGDVFTGGLDWTRSVRLGGVQVSTDFSIRPDLVTFPVPTVLGRAAVPSTVDVLLDGVQLLSHDVPPGPFEIRQLPVVVGAGDISLVVRDPSGRETTRTLSIYASRRLLIPGLDQFSAEAGSVRLSYGQSSNDYRMPAAYGTYRRGLTDSVTVEAHVEGDAGAASRDGVRSRARGGMAGGGASFAIGHFGVFTVDAAGSRFGQRNGMLASVSLERITPILSVEASVTAAGNGFADVAAVYNDPVPTLQARMSLGLELGRFGAVGAAYVARRRSLDRSAFGFNELPERPSPATNPFGEAALSPRPKASLLSASYSAELPWASANIFVTGFHDFASGAGSGVTAGMTFPLGSRASMSTSADVGGGQSYASVQASRSVTAVGDIGGRVEVDGGGLSRAYGLGEYKSPIGLIDGEVDRIDGHTSLRGNVRGSIAYVDGRPWASNTVYDSFAIVDANAPGIAVLQENRFVGRTDQSGSLLVPDLRSFEANRLGIDPADVPADASVGATERLVRPRDRSGVVVRFPVTASRGAILHLVDGSGVPLPVGGALTMRVPGATAVVIGYDGEAYVAGLSSHGRADVVLPTGGRCSVTFEYRARRGIVPDIGPLRCIISIPRAIP